MSARRANLSRGRGDDSKVLRGEWASTRKEIFRTAGRPSSDGAGLVRPLPPPAPTRPWKAARTWSTFRVATPLRKELSMSPPHSYLLLVALLVPARHGIGKDAPPRPADTARI